MKRSRALFYAAVILIAVMGWLLRVVGLNWDDYSRLHPDERFMTTIVSRIGSADNLTDQARDRCGDPARWYSYFDTDCSVWNPDNINLGSYAYGTLPLFIVRGAAHLAAAVDLGGLPDSRAWTTYDYIHLIGRATNALADTLTALVIFALGKRLFSTLHGLIAAGLYAFAVLPIQLSHFWTVDILSNLFVMVGIYAAVGIAQKGRLRDYVLFGLSFGAALACRINLYPMIIFIPLVVYFRVMAVEPRLRRRQLVDEILLGAAALSIAAISFRVFQPYAFAGPSITHWAINQNWLEETLHVAELTRLPSDGWPPSVQWFNRIPFVYPWYNMVVWGMGIPLGVTATLACAMILLVAVRRRQMPFSVGVLVFWVVVYFAFTGALHQMTMRYYLPLYGPLCLLAVWVLVGLRGRSGKVLRLAVAGTTALWALAYVTIYTQPVTRVEASQWMSDHLPATISLQDQTGEHVAAVVPREAFAYSLDILYRGDSYLSEPFDLPDDSTLLEFETRYPDSIATTGVLQILDEGRTPLYEFDLVALEPGLLQADVSALSPLAAGTYYWGIKFDWQGDEPIRYFLSSAVWEHQQEVTRLPVRLRTPYGQVRYASAEQPLSFHVPSTLLLSEIEIPHVLAGTEYATLHAGDRLIQLRRAEERASNDRLGPAARYVLAVPVDVEAGSALRIETPRPMYLTGTVIATEGAWEDSLPVRFCNYRELRWLVAFLADCDEVHPIDQGQFQHLPLEMAETDTVTKQRRMIGVLQAADYLIVSSNRFYDAQPRVPRRFAMSAQYYDRLFAGELGYDLTQLFQRSPTLLGVHLRHEVLPTDNVPRWLNEFEAEEAFGVYDHPTVFIFQNAGFDADKFPTTLPASASSMVSLPGVIDLDALSNATYRLPDYHIPDSEVVVTLVTWFFGFLALGWIAFPLCFILLPTLTLRGFPIARGAAWLFLALLAWWLTAVGFRPYWTRTGLVLLAVAFISVNAGIAYYIRGELSQYIRSNWRGVLASEGLFIAALGVGLLFRAVAPDLWQLARGGEKPMDFAYLNAVLRTPQFPPPNPWLAGFQINYYYFGFVLAALPIKLGGYAPEVGINLVLATLYGVLFPIVFTLAYELLPAVRPRARVVLAFVGTAFVLLAGNLGTLKLILAPEPNMAPHRWYWYPTRILGESANRAGGAIHEMPVFSFVFGDLHAHILALLPVSLFLVALWMLVRHRARLWAVPLGVLGALMFMTNTWDILLYVPLGLLGLVLAARSLRRFVELGALVALSGFATIAPYAMKYTMGEANGIAFWDGERSLLEPFLLVWGIPIGIAGAWFFARFRAVFLYDRPRHVEVGVLAAITVLVLALPSTLSTSVLCLLLLFAGLALARYDEACRRPVHLGTSLIFAVLLATEHLVVRGDVGRMNTVFKISFQIWLWVGLLVPLILYHLIDTRRYALAALSVVLIGCGLLFPVFAVPARFADGNPSEQITLNGNRFLGHLEIPYNGSSFRTDDDANLILFMRGAIPDFPTIVEWYEAEYQWNNRIAVQTGVPAVVGWANHLRQQYPALGPQIEQRIADVQQLYRSEDAAQVRRIIELYDIDYIVYGDLERLAGSPDARTVFETMRAAGELTLAFQTGSTRLYRVVR